MLATTAALFALLPFLASAAPARGRLSVRDSSVQIYSGRDGKCLSLPAGASPGDGTPVVSVDCSGPGVSKWDINRGSGSVVLSGTNYALDIGLNPGNNGPLKVWTSYPTAPQQTWFYTDDNRIAQTGGTQCLDEGDNGIQTYQCTTGNTNQIFYTRSGSGPTSSASSASASSTSSAPPASSSAAPPPSGGQLIRATAYDNLCLTTQDYGFDVGTPVQLSDCFAKSDHYRGGQIWRVPAPGQTGAIRLTDTLCLDAGDNPANGSDMKVWTCYDGLLQQTWTVQPNGGLISLANGQCLDVERESGEAPGVFYPRKKSVQTWACSGPDPQQQFQVTAA